MTALVEAVVPVLPLDWRVGTLRLMLIPQKFDRQLYVILEIEALSDCEAILPVVC